MITVDFGPAWELACLEKIHLGCAGQGLTRTATYSTDHIQIRYMSNLALITKHPCTPPGSDVTFLCEANVILVHPSETGAAV